MQRNLKFKFFVTFIGGLSAVALQACSSNPVTATQKVDIEAPDFKVREATPGGREGWLDSPQIWAEEKGWNAKENFYYTGDAKSADKRMACEKAQAILSDDIARQVATFVDTAIVRASSEMQQVDSGSTTSNSQVSEESQRLSSQLSKATLNNINIKKQYWEDRDYAAGGGARSLYYCWVLGEVSKKDVNDMVVRARTLRVEQNPELKAKVDQKITDMGAEYDKYQKEHR